jgi:hypothetical protein
MDALTGTRKTMRLRTLLSLFPLLVLPVLGGCGDDITPAELGPDLSIPEIKGPKVYAGAYGNLPPAVTDSMVVFVAGAEDRLLIIDSRSGAQKTVATGILIHGVSAAGGEIYWTQETDSARFSLFHWLGGSSERVSDNASALTGQWPADGLPAVGSADGAAVAYVAKPDSLMIYTPSTAETRYVRSGCDQVVAMSPDGSAVICLLRLTRTYVIYDASTGAVRTDIDIPSDVETRAHEIRWDATSGVRVLYAESGRYVLYDEASGTRTPVGDNVVTPISLGVSQTALSPDGSHVAFWQLFCAQKRGDACAKTQVFLMIYDASLGGVRRAAIHTLPTGVRTGGALAFSSSGHALYYVVGSDVYMVTL